MSTSAIAIPQTPPQRSLELNTFAEVMKFAEVVAASDLAPKDYRGKPGNIVVAIQFGKELGVAPMQALQGIAVINGRPSVWGDLMWALVTSHPQFEDCIEEVTEEAAIVTLKRRGRSPVTSRFSKFDAERAGLWGKAGPWTQYPKRQMQWRARTFAARDLFPDALKGLTLAEEVMDYADGPTIDAMEQHRSVVERPTELQKKKPAQTASPEPQQQTQAEPDPQQTQQTHSQPAQQTQQSTSAGGAVISEAQSKLWWAKASETHGNYQILMQYLREVHHVGNKKDILASRWQEALDWANGEL